MPTNQVNQISIDPWTLQYANQDGYQGIDETVPSMQVQITFQIDPPTGILTIGQVQLLNSDALEVTSGVISRGYNGLGPRVPKDGQTYITGAQILLNGFSTLVELEQGTYWAECDVPKNQQGVPRFAFRARTGVKFSAQTTYYTQKFSASTGWSQSDKATIQPPSESKYLTSNWSGLDQMGAHAGGGPGSPCLPMGAGVPKGVWQFAPPQTFTISPPPVSSGMPGGTPGTHGAVPTST